MANLMVKIGRLDKAVSTPPQLPLPTTLMALVHQPALLVPPSTPVINFSSQVRLPKVEVAFFKGDDVISWLFQINQFFILIKY